MTWLILLGLLVCVYLVYYLYLIINRPCKGPFLYPVVWGLPHALKGLRENRFFEDIAENVGRYGSTWSFCLPGRPFTIETCNPANVRHILIDNFSNYEKPPDMKRDFEIVFGKRGIFIVDGEDWKRQRKTASHMFKVRSLKMMIPVFNKHAAAVLDQLETACETGQGLVDVQRCFSNYTLASILEIAFGVHMSHDDFREFHMHFDRLQSLAFLRLMSPLFRLRNALGFPSQAEIHIVESSQYMRSIAENILNARKQVSEEDLRSSDDLLSRYLLLGTESDEMIVEVLLNFLVAGRDTTTVTTAFAVYLLAKNPQKCEVLLKELREHFPDGVADSDLTFDATDERLPYLSGVVRETLRLYPAVPMDPKYALHDDVLPSGVRVRAGSIVAWHGFAMGRSAEYWHEPEEFRPERWTQPNNVANGGIPVPKSNGGSWVPFQAGPRVCLGMRMALNEVHALLVRVVLAYRFDVVAEPILVPQITLAAKDGIQLRATRRVQ